ncbi:hypothetical protein BDV96DRAFT_647963 [Lophiotrema nucula]|uniref:Uncharacterized protein n=1 Tax=Lophiotrema nucula TaxID=690887 RepID=A0A6A5Z3R7_9PLEO|nr:hypothetical protein BDV96DRAFT_647963 [Lophiotrema nucula]
MHVSSLQSALSGFIKTGSPRKALTLDTETQFDDQHTKSLLQPILYSQDEKRSRTCKIVVKLHTCVHGYLAPDEREAASLVIFSVSLNCSKQGRRFSRFKMDVDFSKNDALGSTSEKDSKSAKATGPAILRYAPHWTNSKERTIDGKEETTRKVSANAEVNLKVGGKGAKTGVTFQEINQITEAYKHHYFEKCRSATRCQPNSDIPGAVEWVLLENNQPNAKDDAGLTPEVLFAVLLQRPDEEKFQLRLSMQADAGKRDLCGKYWDNVNFQLGVFDGARKMVDYAIKSETETVTTLLDPEGLKYWGDFAGIQRNNLAKFAAGGALQKLTESQS